MPGSEYYMIQGIACGTRLYYIAGDKEDATTPTSTIEYPWPTLESILRKYSDEVGNAIH
jgi:hypothetical protein